MPKNKEKLIIIDGNALIHRSFHAIPPTLRAKDGRLTNAVYGFSSFLLKAVNELKPDYIILTLDMKGPTFRHEAYTAYKATRTKAPDELYEQIPLVKEVATALNIPIFELSGYEADDLIGTICAELAGQKNLQKIIMTGDMDTLQLIRKDVNVYTMSRGLSDSVLYDAEKVRERYGFGPEKMIEYKALRGDPSDNIPGVKGIGEKSASELIAAFGGLEGIYEAVEKGDGRIKERIANLLTGGKASAYMSRELATINCQAPIKIELEKAKFPDFDAENANKVFSELGFRSLISRLPGKMKEERAAEKKKPESAPEASQEITSASDLADLLKKIQKAGEFSFCLETGGVSSPKPAIGGIGISLPEGGTYYIPCPNGMPEGIREIFASTGIMKTGHDLKTAWRIFKDNGLEFEGKLFDSMVASYVIDPARRQHDLEYIVFSELGLEIGAGAGKKSGQLSLVPDKADEKAREAGTARRAGLISRLKPLLYERMEKEGLLGVFESIEMPLIPVLGEMEENGIKFDPEPIDALAKETAGKIAALEKKIYKLAGKEFNINSTKQLKEILFVHLGIPTKNIKKTKTGFSTAEDELDKLEGLHPIIPELKAYREANKLMTTYLSALPSLAGKEDGRIHTCFNQTITSTGRLSSTDPNLQNIPARTEEGKMIRSAFVAEKGYQLASLDYSQIELRLAAHISGDKKMIAAFKEGLDIHTATAAEINGVPLDAVTKKMRRAAKATNFGIIYGQGPHGLSQAAGISFAEASGFIKRYFESYPDIKKMMDRLVKEAREKGYAETLSGRKRYLPDINSSIPTVRKAAERMAINAPLQGTAADIIKKAMIGIYEEIKGRPEEIRLLLQVHDELIFEIRKDKVAGYLPRLEGMMSRAARLKVPLIVEGGAGDNWGELK